MAQNITVDSIVNDYLIESEQGEEKYFKCWQAAFRGMDECGIDFFYAIRTEEVPVLANKTAVLPQCIKWTKIAVFNSSGELIGLKYNSNLSQFSDLSPNRVSNTTDTTLFSWVQLNSPIFYNFWNGSSFNNMYGFPAGPQAVGTFRVDEQANLIILSQQYTYAYVIVEYVSAPKEGNEYLVPVQFREALISYIAWKDVKSMPSTTHVNNAEKNARRHEFFNDRRLAWARYKPTLLEQRQFVDLEMQRLALKG